MFKINYNITIYRYEIILAAIVLMLTGSIVVSSPDNNWQKKTIARQYAFKIALTFDDGPHPVYTGKIIEILRKHRVPGTFFVVGIQAIKYPGLVRDIVSSGNEIAGHGFTHRNLAKLSANDDKIELESTSKILNDITGVKIALFRPPGGRYDKKVVKVADTLGEKMVLWDVFPKDHEENNSQIILHKVLAQAKDGGIILLHSGRTPTIEALDEIIDSLEKRGFEFVKISDLDSATYCKGFPIEGN
jgi:peptidoglycan-N-acetylglucosamine deacetylase